MDVFSKAQRTRIMSSVRARNTSIEVEVRQLLHKMGYRFRLHRSDLPGTPDIVLPRHRKVVFVHGCFWHGHDCRRGERPSSNVDFWKEKLDRNRERDAANLRSLEVLGWRAHIVWECHIFSGEYRDRLVAFMES